MSRRSVSAVCCAALWLVATVALASGEGTARVRTEDDPRGEIVFQRAELAGFAAKGTAEAPLSVRFEIPNHTAKRIYPEVQVIVTDSSGALRGYHGLTLAAVEPGQTRRYLVRTDSVRVSADDVVVLSPAGAREEVKSAFDRFLKYNEVQCDSVCGAKEATCETRCWPNGVESFSCSCPSGGGITYQCRCMARPSV